MRLEISSISIYYLFDFRSYIFRYCIFERDRERLIARKFMAYIEMNYLR